MFPLNLQFWTHCNATLLSMSQFTCLGICSSPLSSVLSEPILVVQQDIVVKIGEAEGEIAPTNGNLF